MTIVVTETGNILKISKGEIKSDSIVNKQTILCVNFDSVANCERLVKVNVSNENRATVEKSLSILCEQGISIEDCFYTTSNRQFLVVPTVHEMEYDIFRICQEDDDLVKVLKSLTVVDCNINHKNKVGLTM